jgi:hypothetical protein
MQSIPISVKHGGNVAILLISQANLVTQKEKLRRLVFGLNLPFAAVICQRLRPTNLMKPTTAYSLNSCG